MLSPSIRYQAAAGATAGGAPAPVPPTLPSLTLSFKSNSEFDSLRSLAQPSIHRPPGLESDAYGDDESWSWESEIVGVAKEQKINGGARGPWDRGPTHAPACFPRVSRGHAPTRQPTASIISINILGRT
ncbi:Patatin [Psidium guajava]|nr:Patatin [Psidium guajava]